MPDVQAFVRRHLAAAKLPPDRIDKVVEELSAQLEDSYEALVADGLSPQEAWNQLQRELPDWHSVGAELAAEEPRVVLAGTWSDLRASIRLLLKDRGFTAATVLTLAVCLGANVAIFTVVYAVLLRPLPIPEPERIVAMGDVYPTITPNDILSNTAPSYVDRRAAITTLEEQALFAYWFDTLAGDGPSEELRGMRVTPSLFRLLRVAPALGRTFADAEGEVGGERKIILSHGLWQRLYGGNPSAVGRDVRLGWTGERYTIVGVMPAGFSFFDVGDDGHARTAGDDVQFWIPLALTPAQLSDDARTRYGFYHVGRMRAGVTVEQVQAQIDALTAATIERYPQFGLAELGMYTAVTPLQEALTRKVAGILYLLWGGALFVLLIGALNLANLAIARASARRREVATRLALGAGRFRVLRQFVVESVVLAAAGGVAGVAVGAWILEGLSSSGVANLPNAAAVGIDWLVAMLGIAVAVAVGVLIGAVPAIVASRTNVNQALADGSRLGTGGRTTRAVRRGLVVAQVAFSVMLLIGAGLLLTSFRNLLAVDAGFNGERVATATIFPPPSRYQDQAAVNAFSDRLLEAVRAIPGVEAAGITSNIPLSGRTSPATVSASGSIPQPGEAVVLPSVVSVTPGFFEAMATPLVRGRYFDARDRAGSLRAAIVDERLAARLWPNQDPIGKGVHRGNSERYTVVGVVRDVRFEGLATSKDAIGTAYFPHTQAPPLGRLRWIAVKTASDPAAIMPLLRSTLASIDPDLPLSDLQTMTERTWRSVMPQRLATELATLFGVVALMLSALGIYSVLAYLVAQRTREIGIRMALGSTARDIVRLVVAEGLALVAAGLLLGVGGAVALSRTLQGHLFGVTTTDPIVLAAVLAGTGVTALLACLSPARRAARIDPLECLNAQ